MPYDWKSTTNSISNPLRPSFSRLLLSYYAFERSVNLMKIDLTESDGLDTQLYLYALFARVCARIVDLNPSCVEKVLEEHLISLEQRRQIVKTMLCWLNLMEFIKSRQSNNALVYKFSTIDKCPKVFKQIIGTMRTEPHREFIECVFNEVFVPIEKLNTYEFSLSSDDHSVPTKGNCSVRCFQCKIPSNEKLISVDTSANNDHLCALSTNEVWIFRSNSCHGEKVKTNCRIRVLCSTQNGCLLGDNEGKVHLWDLEKGKRLAFIDECEPTLTELVEPAINVCSPYKFICALNDLSIGLWSLSNSSRPEAIFLQLKSNCKCVRFHPSGQYVASGYEDGAVLIHETNGRYRVLRKFLIDSRPVFSVEFSTDGVLFAASNSNGVVNLFDLSKGQIARRISTNSSSPVISLAFSHASKDQGYHLTSVNKDGHLFTWSCTSKNGHPITAPEICADIGNTHPLRVSFNRLKNQLIIIGVDKRTANPQT
ncbi:hypothetical protein ACOME3_009792 [Neoechinorhynchus agilis]